MGRVLHHNSNTTWHASPTYYIHMAYLMAYSIPLFSPPPWHLCNCAHQGWSRWESGFSVIWACIDHRFEGRQGKYETGRHMSFSFLDRWFPWGDQAPHHPKLYIILCLWIQRWLFAWREFDWSSPATVQFLRPDWSRNPLNPIPLYWAAFIRFRRLIRQDPSLASTLARHVIHVLQAVVQLHAAIIWNPANLKRNSESRSMPWCSAAIPRPQARALFCKRVTISFTELQ